MGRGAKVLDRAMTAFRSMTDTPLEDLLLLVCREVSAREVRIVAAEELRENDPLIVHVKLASGAALAAWFDQPPADPAALRARMEALRESFAGVLDAAHSTAGAARVDPSELLHQELSVLASRAGARAALVIDARSPVVWGAAADSGSEANDHSLRPILENLTVPSALLGAADPSVVNVLPHGLCEAHRVAPLRLEGELLHIAMEDPDDADAVRAVVAWCGHDVEPFATSGAMLRALIARTPEESNGRRYDPSDPFAGIDEARRARADRIADEWRLHALLRRALTAVRALPAMESLPRGGQLLAHETRADWSYWARSFGGIYVLVLAYDGPYEDLRLHRAVSHALPMIERLVTAIPPEDPTPQQGQVVALRGRRRR